MSKHDILKQELTTDPLELGYASMLAAGADGDVVAALSVQNYTLNDPVDIGDLYVYMTSTGAWFTIKAAAADPTHPAFQAAFAAVDVVGCARIQRLDFELPMVQTMMAALVAGSLITQEQADYMAAMGNRPASRAEVLGLSYVTADDVAKVREEL